MTETTKHTPGPWKWHKDEAMIESAMPNFRNEYEHICDFRTHALNGSYNEADAQLIAAAPELLEACEAMVGWFNHPEIRFKMCDGGRGNLGEQSAYHRMMQAARHAITKATQSTTGAHT